MVKKMNFSLKVNIVCLGLFFDRDAINPDPEIGTICHVHMENRMHTMYVNGRVMTLKSGPT